MTTGDLILKLLAEHPKWSNREIAEEVRLRKPNARTTAASVASTKPRAKVPEAVGATDGGQEHGRFGTRVLSPRVGQDLAMPTTNDLVLKLWRENPSWSNGEIADEVRRRRPDARTTAASVSSTKSRAKASGAAAGTADDRARRGSDPGVRFRVPAEHRESHFIDKRFESQLRRDVPSLIESGESAVLEFKSTAWLDMRKQEKNPEMVWSVVKTIAAFMNTNGGTLLIGVDDMGQAVGLENDYPFVKGRDRDGWERSMTTAVKNALGPVAATDLLVGFFALDGRTVARIDVHRGAEPVYAERKGKQPPKVFYARLNNATEELSGPALVAYNRKRWPE